MKIHGLAAGSLLLLAPLLLAEGPAEPCADFYAYANTAWLTANPIPEGQSRWSPRSAGRVENQRRLQTLLTDADASHAPAGSAERLAGDFYASCLDEPRVDAAGVAPLQPLLAEIDAAQTPSDVQRVLRHLHAIGVSVGFTTAGAPSYQDPKRFVLNVSAGRFDAPADRAHVAAILALGGGTAEADAIVALEAALSQGALDPSVDPAQLDHPTTFTELVALAPSVDWANYLDEAGLGHDAVNVAEPRLLRQLDRALRQTPVAVWRSYLRYRLLDAAAPYLSHAFVEASPARGKARAAHCAETTEALLGDAVGQIYVERHFPPAARARVEAMVTSLRAAVDEGVASAAWMSPATRTRALEKLAAYDAQVAAPHSWKNLSNLPIQRDAFWANVVVARHFAVQDDRRRIGRPTDRNVWLLPASSSAAYIDAQLNQIVLPAGFLLGLGFRPGIEDPELYGGIGVGVAHDITHAIDAGGADFDAQGRPLPWWSASDREQFQARAACVDDQYAAFEVEPGLRLDGKRVESEAIGDLGGVRLAYRALVKALAEHPVPVRDGVTAEQRFFEAWAHARAEAATPETLRALAKTDSHAPGRFRVLGTLANLPEFAQAFGCRPVETRCSIW